MPLVSSRVLCIFKRLLINPRNAHHKSRRHFDFLLFKFFFFSGKTRLSTSYELSARHTIHIKSQALFSLKKIMSDAFVEST